jgi:hypothetical protein
VARGVHGRWGEGDDGVLRAYGEPLAGGADVFRRIAAIWGPTNGWLDPQSIVIVRQSLLRSWVSVTVASNDEYR